MTVLEYDPKEPLLQDYIKNKYFVLNGTDLNPIPGYKKTVTINWDGDEVGEGKWIDTKLFKIGKYQITYKVVAAGTALTVILILIAIAICAFISYRKREKILIQSRKSFKAIRRMSTRLTMSRRPTKVDSAL